MNEVVNKFLLAGDKLMPEMHLKQPGLIVLVDHLLKTKKEFKHLKKQEIQTIFTYMRLSFQHDMAYGDFKDLERRTTSDKSFKR